MHTYVIVRPVFKTKRSQMDDDDESHNYISNLGLKFLNGLLQVQTSGN